MELAARTGAWSGNPLPYLRRVAYLESESGQYIISPVIYDSTKTIEFEMSIAFIVGTNPIRVGWDAGAMLRVRTNGWDNGSVAQTQIFGDVYSFNKFTVKINSGTNTQTDYTYGTYGSNSRPHSGISGYSAGIGFPLFTFVSGSIQSQEEKIRYESFKANVDGELVCDFVPVLDLSGRPAMYDEVSGQFFYNASGVGEFNWGELDAATALVSSRGGGGY